MDTGTFVLHFSNGDEIYAVNTATIQASEEGGAVELLLSVDTKAKPIQTLPDTVLPNQRPNAEVSITLKKLDAYRLVGRRFSVPTSWSDEKDDHVSSICYLDHLDLDKNVVRFLEQQGNKFLVHWTGAPAGLDDPAPKLAIKAWFTFKEMRKWLGDNRNAAPDRGQMKK